MLAKVLACLVLTLAVLATVVACGAGDESRERQSRDRVPTGEPSQDTDGDGSNRAFGSLGPNGRAYAKPVGDDDWVPWEDSGALVAKDQLIVVVDEDANRRDVERALDGIGGAIVGALPSLGIYQVEVPTRTALSKAIDDLVDEPVIDDAFPNPRAFHNQEPPRPNDPFYYRDPDSHFDQFHYYLDEINAPEAWQLFKGSPVVTIAIVDTGVDEIEDLRPKIVNRIDIRVSTIGDADSTPEPVDCGSTGKTDLGPKESVKYHGTEVAGVAAAIPDNGVGMAGLAWAPTLAAVKISDGSTSFFDTAAGIDAAIETGSKVVNVSIASGWSDALFDGMGRLIEKASDRDVLVVAGAGNDPEGVFDRSRLTYLFGAFPAKYAESWPNVISVGSTNRGSFENGYGATITVSAPNYVITYDPCDSEPQLSGGTSFATPQVSGLAALIWSMDHEANGEFTLSPGEVRNIIVQTAANPENDPDIGAGVIDAAAALQHTAVRVGYEPPGDSDGQDPTSDPRPDGSKTPAPVVPDPVTDVPPAFTHRPGELIWQHYTGLDYSSSPRVVDDVVYTGNESGALQIFDARTGQLIREYDLGPRSVGGRVLRDTTMYVVTEGPRIRAWSLWAGQPLWDVAVGDGELQISGVVDGVLYASTTWGDRAATPETGYVYALDAADGQPLWRYETGFAPYQARVVDGILYAIVITDGIYQRLLALDAATGKLVWQYDADSPDGWTLPIVGGVVHFFSTDRDSGLGYVNALDATNGERIWRYEIGESYGAALTVRAGKLYAGFDSSETGYTIALDARNGDLLWTFDTGSGSGIGPLIAPGVVYSTNHQGYLYAIDADTGNLLWQYGSGGDLQHWAWSGSDVVYVMSPGRGVSWPKEFQALDAGTGELLWTFGNGSELGLLRVVDGIVYVHTRDGYLMAIAGGR